SSPPPPACPSSETAWQAAPSRPATEAAGHCGRAKHPSASSWWLPSSSSLDHPLFGCLVTADPGSYNGASALCANDDDKASLGVAGVR
ncbi:unnamed protein product, partial [Urochloa humidicola]